MKKVIGISILCLLVLSLAVLEGCSSQKEQKTPVDVAPQTNAVTSNNENRAVDTSDRDFDQAIAVPEDDVTIGEMI